MGLIWKQDGRYHTAHSGSLQIGSIVEREDGTIAYKTTDAVHMRWIAKTHGEVASLRSAKRAVERAWATWLESAALTEA